MGAPSGRLRGTRQGSGARPATSAAVTTRTTPGTARAAAVSMPRMRAAAWGLRTKTACSAPCGTTSSL